MTTQPKDTTTGLTFKTAILLRRAMIDGGLFVTMMPGVFTTDFTLADGIKTHVALSHSKHTYVPVEIDLDGNGEIVAVTSIQLIAALSALKAYEKAIGAGIDADPELWRDASLKGRAALNDAGVLT